jgi:hypothetical protein
MLLMPRSKHLNSQIIVLGFGDREVQDAHVVRFEKAAMLWHTVVLLSFNH